MIKRFENDDELLELSRGTIVDVYFPYAKKLSSTFVVFCTDYFSSKKTNEENEQPEEFK